jgi:hypothetical protein
MLAGAALVQQSPKLETVFASAAMPKVTTGASSRQRMTIVAPAFAVTL